MSPSKQTTEQWTEAQLTMLLRRLHAACQSTPVPSPGTMLPWLRAAQFAQTGVAPEEVALLVAQGLVWQAEASMGLTPAGLALVERSGTQSGAVATLAEQRPRPRWLVTTRTLLSGGLVVKRLLATATTEIALLNALEAQGWPKRLANPLTGPRRIRARRLREGARSLSKCQHCRLLVFAVEEAAWLTWRYVE
jgi:hypothetical protein